MVGEIVGGSQEGFVESKQLCRKATREKKKGSQKKKKENGVSVLP